MRRMERRTRAEGILLRAGIRLAVVLMLLSSVTLHASGATIVSAEASAPSNERTILSIKLDSPVDLVLLVQEGRTLLLAGASLPTSGLETRSRGSFVALRAAPNGVEVVANRYVTGRILSAGTGVFLLFLEPAKEPLPVAAPVTDRQQSPALKKQETEAAPGSKTIPAEAEQGYDQKTLEKKKPSPLPQGGYGGVALSDAGSPSGQSPLMTGIPTVLPEVVQIGVQIARQGDLNRALTYLSSIQPHESGYGWSRIVMGELLEEQGNMSRALDVYREALLDPGTESVASVHLALSFQSQGNPEAASGMWERVLELNGGRLYQPADASEIRGRTRVAGDSNAGSGYNEVQSGRPLWLVIVLSIVGLALLGAVGFGGMLLYRMLKSRVHAAPAELGLGEELYEEDAVDPTPPPRKGKGAVAKAAKSYEANTPKPQAEPRTNSQSVDRDGNPSTGISPEDEDEELSDTKRRKLEAMYRQGSTVREIAETLGVGQDEVRMAINLAEATKA